MDLNTVNIDNIFKVPDILIEDAGTNIPMFWQVASKKKIQAEKAEQVKRVKNLAAFSERIRKRNAKYAERLAYEKARIAEERKLAEEKRQLEIEEIKQRKIIAEQEHEQEMLRLRLLEVEQERELKQNKLNLEMKAKDDELRIKREKAALRQEELLKIEAIKREELKMKREAEEAGIHELEMKNETKRGKAEYDIQLMKVMLTELQREYEKKQAEYNARLEARIARENKLKEYANLAEERRIETLRKAHHTEDVAFIPYRKNYPEPDPKNLIELYEVSLINLKLKRDEISFNRFLLQGKGVSVYGNARISEIEAIIAILSRRFNKDYIINGGEYRYMGEDMLQMNRNKFISEKLRSMYIMPIWTDSDLPAFSTVQSFMFKHIPREKTADIFSLFVRLSVSNPKRLMGKRIITCTLSELAKIHIVIGLLCKARLIILTEPQRWLDCASRKALHEIINEWSGQENERAMLLFTSDELLIRMTGDNIRRIGNER